MGVKQYVPLLSAAHQQRISTDPDFVHLVNQLEFSNSWDADKTISLSLEKRRLRSTQWDDQQLLLENQRRKSKGLEVYANREAWKAANKEDDEDEDTASEVADNKLDNQENSSEDEAEEENIAESDPMLQEAGYILSDQIRILSKPSNKRLLVLRQSGEK